MRRFVPLALATLLVGAGCSPANADDLRLEILGTRPHDVTAYTQGLEIVGAVLYEGTGNVGQSRLRTIDLHTGRVLAHADLDPDFFGEGITVVGPNVWQITWQNQVAVERDAVTLTERRRVRYDGEGWGVCAQPDRLVMSDGSNRLTFRDRTTFASTGSVQVDTDARFNELECTRDGSVWANAWPTDTIVRIDPNRGTVTGRVDAAELRKRIPGTAAVEVLNGIAQIPGTDRFLITGKYWPLMFEVRFIGQN